MADWQGWWRAAGAAEGHLPVIEVAVWCGQKGGSPLVMMAGSRVQALMRDVGLGLVVGTG